MQAKQCPKCSGEMKKGFFYVRNSEHPIFFNYVVWIEGEKNDITKFMGSNEGVQQFPVTPYKCSSCGYIEHYTDSPEKWKH